MPISLQIAAAAAFILTTILILSLRPLARTAGLVDIPNERKVHDRAVPLVGGISIFLGIACTHLAYTLLLPGVAMETQFAAFYLGGAMLVFIGVVDDYRELSPSTRIIVQVIAALVMIYGGDIVVRDIGEWALLGGAISLGVLSVPFTVVATVGVINAVNMSDGLDGLAGSLTLVSLLGYLFATSVLGNGDQLVPLTLLVASVVGFLLFNVTVPGKRRALIFLGDAGSMLLGFTLVWFAVSLSQGETRAIKPAAALWFLIVPILDAVCMMARRIARRRPVFSADKEHLHHVFLLAGFTVTETVLIMAGLTALGVVVGLAGTYFDISDLVLIGAYVISGLLYYWMIARAWSVMRFLRRSICRRRIIGDRRSNGERRRIIGAKYIGVERRSGKDRRTTPYGRRESEDRVRDSREA